MNKFIRGALAAASALSLLAAVAVPANAAVIASETFVTGTGDWIESGATIANDAGTLRVTGAVPDDGAYSYFNGVTLSTGTERTTPLGDGYIAQLDVYLDPTADQVGDGFDLTVAASKADGTPLRDFIFHVGTVTDGRLLVNGSNNTDGIVNEYKLLNENAGAYYEVTNAGRYTLQHSFYENATGALAVDLNLLDSTGDVLWTATRTNAADLAVNVGGARYQWLTVVDGSFQFDNQSLTRVTPKPILTSKDQCRDDVWKTFGFKNQGQCIASLTANVNAGK